MRVLIVGAGPTGLTTAVELARQGITPEVIDQREDPSSLSRAVGILPRSLKLLELSGVTQRLLDEGIHMQSMEIFKGSRSAARISIKGGHPEHDYVVALAQDRTEAALRDTLTEFGGTVSYGQELIALHQKNERVVVHTREGAEDAFDLVVGADGIRSKTRECAGIDYPGFDLPETWSIADVDAQNWINPDSFTVCLLADRKVVVVAPLEPTRYRVVSNTENALQSLPLPLDITGIRREGTFTISIRQATHYNKGRVYLAGDAAHCHSPVGGRGMNLGIADAADLAHRIVKNDLTGYSTARHADGVRIIAQSEQIRGIFTTTNPITRMIRNAFFPLINASTVLQRRAAQRMLGD